MKIMMSSCLVGKNVLYSGGNLLNDFLNLIIEHPQTHIVHFCPEDIVLGTPRKNMLIHGGDGMDVLTGSAQILDTDFVDKTEIMLSGAQKMLEFARCENPDLIILTEGSDSCGSRLILDPAKKSAEKYAFKKGMGLAAALLKENGFKILGHLSESEIHQTLFKKLKNYPDRKGLRSLEDYSFYPKSE